MHLHRKLQQKTDHTARSEGTRNVPASRPGVVTIGTDLQQSTNSAFLGANCRLACDLSTIVDNSPVNAVSDASGDSSLDHLPRQVVKSDHSLVAERESPLAYVWAEQPSRWRPACDLLSGSPPCTAHNRDKSRNALGGPRRQRRTAGPAGHWEAASPKEPSATPTAQTCNPHSVFPVPAQRPSRGLWPSGTGTVVGAQPIET